MMVAGEKKPKGSRGRHLERTLERSSWFAEVVLEMRMKKKYLFVQ
jgi:hypothetical protein